MLRSRTRSGGCGWGGRRERKASANRASSHSSLTRKDAVLRPRWVGSLAVMGAVLVSVTNLACADDEIPMFGDYKVIAPLIPVRVGAFKIGENESPRPQDRVYINYNFYEGIKRDLAPGREDNHRETLGVEKTVFGDTSLGLRLPFFEGIDGSAFAVGDLSLVVKHALVNENETGNTLAGGLVLTVPSGEIPHRVVVKTQQNIQEAFFQPFIGYRWNSDDVFIHAFHSILLPTDSKDYNVLFNDIGVGYWAYRGQAGQFLTGVIPTFEVHINTPLTHRSVADRQRYRDTVDLTAGAHFELNKNYLLGIAFAAPVTNTNGFNFEVITNFHYQF